MKHTNELTDAELIVSAKAFIGAAGILASRLQTLEEISEALDLLYEPGIDNSSIGTLEYLRAQRVAICALSKNERRFRSVKNMKKVPSSLASKKKRNAARLAVSLRGPKREGLRKAIRKIERTING